MADEPDLRAAVKAAQVLPDLLVQGRRREFHELMREVQGALDRVALDVTNDQLVPMAAAREAGRARAEQLDRAFAAHQEHAIDHGDGW